MRWSFSQWETYEGCPAKWKYRGTYRVADQRVGQWSIEAPSPSAASARPEQRGAEQSGPFLWAGIV